MLFRLMFLTLSWLSGSATAGEQLFLFPGQTDANQRVEFNVKHPQEKLVLSLSVDCGLAVVSENGDCPTLQAPPAGTPVTEISRSGWKSYVVGEYGEQLQVRNSRNWLESAKPTLLAVERP